MASSYSPPSRTRATWDVGTYAAREPAGVRLARGIHQVANADQIERSRREAEDPGHPRAPAVPQLAQQADRFHPPEDFLDAFPFPLTDRVAGRGCGPAINRAATVCGVLRHVR